VVTITGPRQSGKTTLCRMLFPDRPYVSLETPEDRVFALRDPKGFLDRFETGVVIEEVQRAPELLSYIQVYADRRQVPGLYVLTGSQNLLLLDKIAQSLAGRTALVTLLYFFRDSKGLEVDVVLDYGQEIEQLEIKSAVTLASDFFAPLRKLASLHGRVRKSWLVYGGRGSMRREGVQVLGWRDVGRLP
jgi:predicted AAA+ superfamily ATPase